MIGIYLKRIISVTSSQAFPYMKMKYCIESFNFKYQTVKGALYDRKQSLQSFPRKAAL